MVVVTVIVVMFVMGVSRMRISAVRIVVMLDLVAARIAGMRPENRDQAGENGAQQRQENNRLNHVGISPSSN